MNDSFYFTAEGNKIRRQSHHPLENPADGDLFFDGHGTVQEYWDGGWYFAGLDWDERFAPIRDADYGPYTPRQYDHTRSYNRAMEMFND